MVNYLNDGWIIVIKSFNLEKCFVRKKKRKILKIEIMKEEFLNEKDVDVINRNYNKNIWFCFLLEVVDVWCFFVFRWIDKNIIEL